MPIAFSLISSWPMKISSSQSVSTNYISPDGEESNAFLLLTGTAISPKGFNAFVTSCMSDDKIQNLKKIYSHVSFIVISSPNPDLNTHNIKFCKSLFY
jgi:Asp/Glu/hydantoin racemase